MVFWSLFLLLLSVFGPTASHFVLSCASSHLVVAIASTSPRGAGLTNGALTVYCLHVTHNGIVVLRRLIGNLTIVAPCRRAHAQLCTRVARATICFWHLVDTSRGQ
ncbi:hypothetical protein BHE74_00021716 [Ensete ventricosum]|nr:hypothetical protein GW17_00042767 [Ensete ventricosum]RWW70591.1 hypothetical protein BHE74_00021716 [Ensete ventricosum]